MLRRIAAVIATVIIFSSLMFAAEKSLETAAEVITYADEAYADKNIPLDERKNIMEAVVSAADKFADNYDVQWRAARMIYVYSDMLYEHFQLGNYEKALVDHKIDDVDDLISRSQDLTSSEAKSLVELGSLGRKYADKAVELNTNGVEGHYYNALSIATYAFGKSIVKALLEGLGSKYQEHLDRALEINKDFLEGYIYLAYGRYWYKLPWPKRSIKKSFVALKTALFYNPENIITLDYLGDAYYKDGKKAEAEKCWKAVLASTYQTYHAEYIRGLAAAKLKYFGK